MAEQAHILSIVVASPADVPAERDIVPVVVDELNKGIAADRGLYLQVKKWETHSHPGLHPEGPQGLIDQVLRIEDCDILIGIFWKRFGTPDSLGITGTEHEIRIACQAWEQKSRPQVMVYFNQNAHTPESKEEIEQWGQVLEFRKTFPQGLGLWWTYKGKREFEKLLRNHLTNFIRQKYPFGPLAREEIGRILQQAGQLTEMGRETSAQRTNPCPWRPRGLWKPEEIVAADTFLTEDRDSHLEIGVFVLAEFKGSSKKWKDPLASLLGVWDAKANRLTRIAVSGERSKKPPVLCIPSYDVEVEWRTESHVFGQLWGPIKELVVERFLEQCKGKYMICRVVSLGRGEPGEAILLYSGDYDSYLASEWYYCKGLELALAKSEFYKSRRILAMTERQLRQFVNVTLIETKALLKLLPERYVEGARVTDTEAVFRILDGLLKREAQARSAHNRRRRALSTGANS